MIVIVIYIRGDMVKIAEIRSEGISYQVNPYTELFGIMAILADDNNLYKNAGSESCNSNYRNHIIKWFSAFKDHRAVRLLTRYASDYNFNYDAPCAFFLEMADNLNGFSDYIYKDRLPIPAIELYKFAQEINNFILYSNFKEFYKKNEIRYRRSLNLFIQKTKDYSPEDYLFKFIGHKSDKLAINLMHSVSNSHYGLSTEKYLYVCIMPNGESLAPGEADFAFNLPDITSLILHEFAHSFINPLTKKHKNIVKNIDGRTFQDTLKSNPYGDDINTAINETIIRSIECLYIKDIFPEEYDSFINRYIGAGFSQIPQTISILKEYQKNRDLYTSIDDFYPKLLNSFLHEKAQG